MRAAVLDLGTNTFNLLIGDLNSEGTLHILYNNKIPVKLGQGGIQKGEILSSAYSRGLSAISEHYKTIRKFEVSIIKAFGTSAFRTAANGRDFIAEIKVLTGIEVEIISGDLEAELIYLGVRQTIQNIKGKYLILDIGGGSNEFIIANNYKLYWKKSYPLGIARLIEKFNPSDPLTKEQIVEFDQYFSDTMADLIEIVLKENITTLVGASGAFETFTAMINEDEGFETQTGMGPKSSYIKDTGFNQLYKKLIYSTLSERSLMKGLEHMRIEMIVLAIHFVKFVTETLKIKRIYISNYSLKEGAIMQLLNK